jgi:hypothetical protein
MMPERSFASFAIVEVAVDGQLEIVIVNSSGSCAVLCKLNRRCAEFRARVLVPWRKISLGIKLLFHGGLKWQESTMLALCKQE